MRTSTVVGESQRVPSCSATSGGSLTANLCGSDRQTDALIGTSRTIPRSMTTQWPSIRTDISVLILALTPNGLCSALVAGEFLGLSAAARFCSHKAYMAFRECPGRYWARLGIALTVANTLSLFNITKSRDEQGLEITPQVKFSGGIIRLVPRPSSPSRV